ncbi:ABC transporter substrate-binding protein [Devosia sp. 2618]|uniref:substrate-binding periplasmic protein n=1 Tax=Devosia sp. 2618 TaxID=3156454 RepID=UPI003398DDBF
MAQPKTVNPGVLTIGIAVDMSMTSIADGTLIGTDGEMINTIAENLGLTLDVRQMEWSAVIQSTVQGQVDIMFGSMGWIAERTKILKMTNLIYYYPTTLLQQEGHNYKSAEELAGRTIGSVVGFTSVPEMQSIDGVDELKLYEAQDAAIRDVAAGRIDVAFLDPTLAEYALSQNPDWKLHQTEFTPDDRYPIMSAKYSAVIGVNPANEELYEAINTEVGKLWASCANVQAMSKYGLSALMWFEPSATNYRAGVDRSDEWQPPQAASTCFNWIDTRAAPFEPPSRGVWRM